LVPCEKKNTYPKKSPNKTTNNPLALRDLSCNNKHIFYGSALVSNPGIANLCKQLGSSEKL